MEPSETFEKDTAKAWDIKYKTARNKDGETTTPADANQSTSVDSVPQVDHHPVSHTGATAAPLKNNDQPDVFKTYIRPGPGARATFVPRPRASTAQLQQIPASSHALEGVRRIQRSIMQAGVVGASPSFPPPPSGHRAYRERRFGNQQGIDSLGFEDFHTTLLRKYRKEPEGDHAAYIRGIVVLGPVQHIPQADLDKIRLTLRCYITPSIDDDDTLCVFHCDPQVVETVLCSLRETILRNVQHERSASAQCQNVSNAEEPKPNKVFLARVQDRGRIVRYPVLHNRSIFQHLVVEHHATMLVRQIPHAVLPTEEEWQKWIKDLTFLQAGVLRHAVDDRISQLKSTGDGILLKVRMSVCVFKQYMWVPRRALDLPIKVFVEGLEQDQTDAILNPLNHKLPLLSNALQQNRLLRGIGNVPLIDVKPYYEVFFEIASTESVRSTRQLHITGSYENEEPCLEVDWKMITDRYRVGQLLEIFMVKFTNGLSWKLQVDAAQRPLIPTTAERNFATSIKLEPYDPKVGPASPSRLRFSFVPSLKIVVIRQKTIWRTMLQADSRWIVEITRYDEFARTQHRHYWAPTSSCWDVTIHHRKWNILNNAAAAQDPSNSRLERLLCPDDEELGVHEAISKFCQQMNEISDSLSLLEN